MLAFYHVCSVKTSTRKRWWCSEFRDRKKNSKNKAETARIHAKCTLHCKHNRKWNCVAERHSEKWLWNGNLRTHGDTIFLFIVHGDGARKMCLRCTKCIPYSCNDYPNRIHAKWKKEQEFFFCERKFSLHLILIDLSFIRARLRFKFMPSVAVFF